jgi:hypothetical protein
LHKVETFKVSYFNNELTIDSVPTSKHKDVRALWVSMREDYADWVATVRLKEFGEGKSLVELLEWKGMSSWWINNLVRKDTEGDTQWLHRLMVMYFCNKFKDNVIVKTDDRIIAISLNKNFPETLVTIKNIEQSFKQKIKLTFPYVVRYLRLLRSVLGTFERWLVTWSIDDIDENISSKNKIWFMTTYPANWVKDDNNGWYDRHLTDSPLKDKNYQRESSYLVYILRYIKDAEISFFQLRNELKRLRKKSGRDVCFPESKLKIIDIISAYWSTAREHALIIRWKKKEKFRSLFTIDGMDLSDILIEHLEQSYFGLIQYCKLHGFSTMRFLETMDEPQTIVTYLELFVETRTDYFLKKFAKANTTFYALQHSQESRNYGEAYNRRSEFAQNEEDNCLLYCPMPDFFLIHGEQYKSILSEFYPAKRIHTIGSVKVKQYINSLRFNFQDDQKTKTMFGHDKRVSIVVALSSNDAWFVLNLLSEWKPENDIKIWVTTHPNNDRLQIMGYINKYLTHLDIEIVENVSTWKLLHYINILVCGYSSLIYEGLLFKKSTVTLQPIGLFSPREIDQRIPCFSDIKLFDLWINETINSSSDLIDNNYFDSFFFDYFYYPDGLADERMWNVISTPYNLKFAKSN